MPVPMLKSLAKSSGKSLAELENYWDAAKASAAKAGHKDDYGYIVGIVKRRAGLSEGRADRLLESYEIVTSYYAFAHDGRNPRGYGRWAFGLDTQHPKLSDIIWKHGLYSRVILDVRKENPDRVIYVLP